jgi:predicted alpha/beta-fold hydrolase
MFKFVDFQPLPGLASPHLQMTFANFISPGKAPPTKQWLVPLHDGDKLSCEISTPPQWKNHQPTFAMIHGLGGSHASRYMIRLSRKLYLLGYRVVRINLRGAGSGKGLNNLPYNSGNSQDAWEVVKALKAENPNSPLTMIGFSLGGNIILKMAGEQGLKAAELIKRIIAVCPPLDLGQSVLRISKKHYWMYHNYYLRSIFAQGRPWIKDHSIHSIYEYDHKVTAPLWGYQNALDYYEKCSSAKFIADIQIPCDVLFSADDPFVDHNLIRQVKLPTQANIWVTKRGGHMGYIGWAGKDHGIHWMDRFLLDKVAEFPS